MAFEIDGSSLLKDLDKNEKLWVVRMKHQWEFTLHEALSHLKWSIFGDITFHIDLNRHLRSFFFFVFFYPQTYLPRIEAVTLEGRLGPVMRLKEFLQNSILSGGVDPPKGQLPDYEAPVVLQNGRCSVTNFCDKIHRTLAKEMKYAIVWGTSVKYQPQKVGKDHILHDEDVVQIVKKV